MFTSVVPKIKNIICWTRLLVKNINKSRAKYVIPKFVCDFGKIYRNFEWRRPYSGRTCSLLCPIRSDGYH